MKDRVRFSLLVFFVLSILLSPAFAENNRNRNPGPGVQQQQTLKIFDDKVFETTGQNTIPEERTKNINGKERYINGSFSGYTQEQMRPSACNSQKGTASYGTCVKQERAKMRDELDRREELQRMRRKDPVGDLGIPEGN